MEPPREPTPSEKAWFDGQVRELKPVLLAVAVRQCRNQADAEDLVQATFETALRYLWKFNRGTNFRAWLTAILTHRILRLVRQRRRPVELVSDVATLAGATAEPEAPQAWETMTVEDLVRVLPQVKSPYQETFRLHALEQMSYKEIAAQLGVPMGTVTSRLKRARERLRQLLLPESRRWPREAP